MKLSLRGEYALRALIELAEAKPEDIVPIQSVSKRQQIPKRFLEQILNDLRSGGFVESKRGIAGGYRLARSSRDITLFQVIKHIEGGFTSGPQSGGPQTRLQPGALEAQMVVQSAMKEAQDAVEKVLIGITLANLSDKTRQLRNLDQVLDYNI